jgi:predicted nucleotidyltransferase
MNPEKPYTLTQLAAAAGIAKSAASTALPKLEREGIIRIERIGTAMQIRAAQEGATFQRRKLAWNLTQLLETNLIDILDEHYHRPKAIILFGSYRYGQDLSTSDIDIAIETTATGTHTEQLEKLHAIEKSLRRNIQILRFDRKSIDKHVFSNIANGIVLHGFLQAKT